MDAFGSDADGRFELCFRAHHAEVLAYALRRLDDRTRADDVVSETCAVPWQRRETLPADPIPWLIGIARNVVRNEHRSARRLARLRARLGGERSGGGGADPPGGVSQRGGVLP